MRGKRYTQSNFIFLTLAVLLLSYFTGGNFVYQGTTYQNQKIQEHDSAFITQYYDIEDDLCRSWVLLPGFYVANKAVLIITYALALFYIFLGISIVSDVFMNCIQVITSKTKKVELRNQQGEIEVKQITVWNATIANLTLMALGSSAPEILLSVIETVSTLGQEPGRLGASTIVGSAAFNFLVISGVSIAAVQSPGVTFLDFVALSQVKKIQQMGVFFITSISSLFAYVWMYITLKVWSQGEISVAEAVITFIFFFILIGSAFGADKCNEKAMKRKQKKEEQARMDEQSGAFASPRSDSGQAKKPGLSLQVFNMLLETEKKGKLRKGSISVSDSKTAGEYLKQVLGKQDLNDVNQQDIEAALQGNQAGNQLLPRIKYRKAVGVTNKNKEPALILRGSTKQKEQLDSGMNKVILQNGNPKIGFKCLHYQVKEGDGHIAVSIVKKCPEAIEVGVRTIEGTATSGQDYIAVDQVLQFKANQNQKQIKVNIVDDDQWEPDQDFYIELYDVSSNAQLDGQDSKCTVTIIDDDQPGVLSFQKAFVQVSEASKHIRLFVNRSDGCDGIVKCKFRTQVLEQNSAAAKPGQDFIQVNGTLQFAHNETVKEIRVKIVQKDSSQRDDLFRVRIFDPEGGVKLSKKESCLVEIVHDDEMLKAIEKIQHAVELSERSKNPSYCQQFKNAILFTQHVDEQGNVIEPSCCDSLLHFASIGWKLLFALIPPPKKCGGWLAFFVSLAFIGVITAIVAEFASLFGCVTGLKPEVTAITFVALGTSLPDTFASMQAAKQSDSADAAVGNVTGSNSVNVFLGLGLPWIIGSAYELVNNDQNYKVNSNGLDFSVMLFLITCVIGLLTIVGRRKCVKGELGGPKGCKIISAVWMILLWVIYILLSSLKIYGDI